MGKYLLIVKNTIQENLVYRFSTFAVFVGETLVFVFFFYLWTSIYSSGQQIGSYSLKGIISYYLVFNFIFLTTKNNNTAWIAGEEIRRGELTNVMLKPISYLGYLLSHAIGLLLYCLAIYSLVYFFLLIALRNYIDLPNNIATILLFTALAILGFFINFFVAYLVGIMAFWLGQIIGLNFAVMSLVTFFEGGLMPLDLLPNFVTRINDFLPFKYVVFVPISVFTGRIGFSWELFLIPLGWVLFLLFLVKIIYRKGLKKYEGYGA